MVEFMDFRKLRFSQIFATICVYFISLILLEKYTYGDQILYMKFYENIFGLSLKEGFLVYREIIGSYEPIYYLISWFFSNLSVPKNIFIAISNAFLVYLIFALTKRMNSSLLIVLLIVITNFYFFAMYTELERLKFGFIFFLLSMLFFEKKLFFYIASFLTVFTHIQFFVLYAVFFCIYGWNNVRNLFVRFRVNKYFIFHFIIILVFTIMFLVLMQEHIENKVEYYFDGFDYVSLLKAIPFFVLIYTYAKKKSEALIFILALSFSVLLFGADRLNIFGFFVFLYYGLSFRRGLNAGVFVTTVYMAFKTIYFIDNIFLYGRGY